ncbi:molybdopterin-dependent oxidoreductase [Paraclostridium ghonii]|uniref:Anaerobic selenocysteine-containing dehydrogenase n=1 Tax=Paraclostridium ghonii TaxID=29358 RepID=A0ABU0MZK5_9FIRM|nr:molybdopterin-dependent oxidoreductase [Paeniclostridium ghonii]MDQ0556301.1 anaerobic selenocysteine-containing dehydrogenase [Paeniclostridium ghonii]
MKILSHGCTLDCFDRCKFNVYVENGEVIKIEGDKKHHATKGFICSKGRSHLKRLKHPERIYKPLIKIDGNWSEISFEEALDIISQKLRFYKDKYSSKSILYYTQYGSISVLKDIGDIFFNFYGGVTKSKGGPCWSAGIKAQEYDYGTSISNSLEDMLNSKSIFIWGKNPAYTTIHTFQMIKKAKEKGVKIIVIDPIYTDTAKIADMHIKINPGTDGALAIAMTKIIIDKDLYDKKYINKHVLGFEIYKEYIASLDVDELLNECGLKKETVIRLVDLYTDKYSAIHIGYGMQRYKNGGNNIRAIDALGAITGQIGFAGGGVNYANKGYSSILNTDPFNSKDYCENRFFYTSHISDFIKGSINSDTPIKMAVITKSNFLNQLADVCNIKESLENIEFKVCFDMFMTDTAKECDLFIPCTNTLESEDLLYSSMANPYIAYNEKVVNPKHILMDEYYFFREIAKTLDIKNYPMVSKSEYLSQVIKPLKKFDENISLDKIKNNYFTIHNSIAWKDKEFETPSKKFELYSENALLDGLTPIPIYIKSYKKNKYRLLTNHYRDSIASQHMMDKDEIAKAYINEKVSSRENIKDNDIVKLVRKNRHIKVQVKINNGILDDTILIYAGWWEKQGNPNVLTYSGISDMGGQVTYNETFVDIELIDGYR